MQADAPERAGYPGRATIRLAHAVATRPLGASSLEWTAERVDLTIAPGAPGTLLVEAGGAQSFRMGAAPPLPFRAADTALRVPLPGDGTLAFLVRALDAGSVRVDRIDAGIAPLAVRVDAGGIQFIPPLPEPFATGADLSTRIVVTQPFPDAAAWQAAGGRIEAPEIGLRWGPLDIAGNADGGLDPQLQPMGQANLRVRGAQEGLAALAKAGLVAPGPASAARGRARAAEPGGAGRPHRAADHAA